MYPTLDNEYRTSNWAVICRQTLGQNHTGGTDYWITLRGMADRLSNKMSSMGIVWENGETRVCELIPAEVAKHIESKAKLALMARDAADAYLVELESSGEGQRDGAVGLDVYYGMLRFWREPGWVITADPGDNTTDRFFIVQTRGELRELRQLTKEEDAAV